MAERREGGKEREALTEEREYQVRGSGDKDLQGCAGRHAGEKRRYWEGSVREN